MKKSKKRRLFGFINFLLFAFCLASMPATVQAQHPPLDGGTGSNEDPYRISTATNLKTLSDYVNTGNGANTKDVYYKLTANIDLGNYQDGAGWVPIGNDIKAARTFFGNFDGNGKKITGLKINATTPERAGLFGYIEKATIKNLIIENADIVHNSSTGFACVGGIVGMMYSNCTISHCYVTGLINSSADYDAAGGIVGSCRNNSTVSNCYSTASISASFSAGGIAGDVVESKMLSNCYATGTISASRAGGLVGDGSDIDRSTEISNCAALNPKINSSYEAARIINSLYSTLINNIAFDKMLNPDGESIWTKKGAARKDGEDITAEQIKADGTLGGRFTTANGWIVENGKLPGLFDNTVEIPEHIENPTGLGETSASTFRIYPNPTTGQLRIAGRDALQCVSTNVEIYDIYGRKCHVSRVTRNENIDISDLSNGIYFLKISTEHGMVTKKIVKY